MSHKKTTIAHQDYKADIMTLSLASPDRIRDWSFGEVLKPETINYRTGRSERGGLFDERVFGPDKDYECYCGKYKRIRYAGVICEKCGVEVTKAIVRRERMGHIELASPVAHIWLLRGIPSRMSLLLDIPVTGLEKVVYFGGYIVTDVYEEERARIVKELDNEYKAKSKTLTTDADKEKLKALLTETKKEVLEIVPHKVLSEAEYHKYSVKYSTLFDAGIGAEAVYEIFSRIDLVELAANVEKQLNKTNSGPSREKLEKRLQLIRALHVSGQRPEWMFLKVIPIIPPALRPMVALEGGRHATSDVNDLYRRVINRNNRLKKLLEIGAPEVILRNEKRILQEAVDSLVDNTIRKHSGSVAMSQSQRRQLKSLADNLKGKQGIFRQNLLGKRVDYSGRSVIVVGPSLKLDQCGLPKHMALELFRPFVISQILKKGMAFNIRGAGRLIEEGTPEVWEILEKVIEGKYVLLNRAPTLHRLSIQAFHPVLIEGKAIQIHPMVCAAFNADFDGDQMAVHVPLSEEAQLEARHLMASNQNLLKPQSGDPVTMPGQDILIGCFWVTKMIAGVLGEGKYFASPLDAITAYEHGIIDIHAKIIIVGDETARYKTFDGKPFETTVGRVLFNETVLPEDFEYLNQEIKKGDISNVIDRMINDYGIAGTPEYLDRIKVFGQKFATISGTTFGMSDAMVPSEKNEIVNAGKIKQQQVEGQYDDGLISEDERYNKVIEIWEGVTRQIEKAVEKHVIESESVHDMITSKARGNISQLTQMSGMKGVIMNTAGRPIDFPIISSYAEGLSPIEYFITNHGSRKGLADTALNTATAGYLTRKLVIVAQDVVITEEDCNTKKGYIVRAENIDGLIKPIGKGCVGRILAENIKTEDGEILFKRGAMITKKEAKILDSNKIESVIVRSPLTCETTHGLCRQCYGLDLGRNNLVKYGEAVGIVAAQAIGEPGTQLTMRTIHSGGVAGEDITMGLPRVSEIFEASTVKIPAVIAEFDGEITDITTNDEDEKVIHLTGEQVKGEGGSKTKTYTVDSRRVPMVRKGDTVKIGDLLTDGAADLKDLFAIAGFDRTQDYIIREVSKIYELQGAGVARKHLEIIVRQMFSRRKIMTPGDTKFTTGQIVENSYFIKENNRIKEEGNMIATAQQVLFGISKVSLSAKSWLSTASFERTTTALVTNAIMGEADELRGIMENVILGNLIPAGTGLDDDFVPEIAHAASNQQETSDIIED
jgi:DNA-directed RNA polymerase subunit beta'